MSWRLSPSKLKVFTDCPRCFWIENSMAVKRPRGLMASLPVGMDSLFKRMSDQYRGTLPTSFSRPETQGLIFYPVQESINQWRNWRTGLYHVDQGHKIGGAFDDVLQNVDTGSLVPFDYKTRASLPDVEYVTKYYQLQLEVYGLAMVAETYPVADYGIIACYAPKALDPDYAAVSFDIGIYQIPISVQNAANIFSQAIACLENKKMPPAAEGCEYCKFATSRAIEEAAYNMDGNLIESS